MENNERPIMSEEERRFKVQKIEKYEEMIDGKERYAASCTFVLGTSILGLVLNADAIIANINANTPMWVVGLLCSFICTFIGVRNLKELLKTISEKTSLQTNLNMLQDELELDDEFQKIKRK